MNIQQTIKSKILIIQNEIFLVAMTTMAEKNWIFLIDSGSQVSLIKAKKIYDAKIDTSKAIEIIGIADNKTLRSLGMTQAYLKFENNLVSHAFHVMNDNIFLRPDGIIGADFLIKYNTIIDVGNQFILLREPEHFQNITQNEVKSLNSFKIIYSYDNNIIDEKHDQNYLEAINDYQNYEKSLVYPIKIKKLSNPSYYEELDESIFQNYESVKTSNRISFNETNSFSLFEPITSTPFKTNYIEIDNPNESPIVLPQERKDYLMKILDLNGLTQSQVKTVSEICLEYSEAFYIPNDKMNPTQIYKHSFKLKPDVDVVNVKQFRIPFVQRDELKRTIEMWKKMA